MTQPSPPPSPPLAGSTAPGRNQVHPAIHYLAVIPEDDPGAASIRQGFSLGITHMAKLVQSLVELPADVLEFALPEPTLSGRRVNGVAAWQWTPAAVYVLDGLIVPAHMPFWVMLTHDPDVADAVDHWIAGQRYRPLHISLAPGPGRLDGAGATPDELRAHFQTILDRVAADDPGIERTLVTQGLEHWDERPSRIFSKPVPGHNVTLPNVMALQGIGMEFVESEPDLGEDPTGYQQWIVTMANAVLDERARSYRAPALRTTPAQPDLYITAPALRSSL